MAKRVKVDVPGIDDMFDPNVFVDRLDNMEEPLRSNDWECNMEWSLT